MGKFLVLALLASYGCKALTGRWPWALLGQWMATPGAGRPAERARARALLGLSVHASREDVIDAHRKLLFQVHPDRGGDTALVHEANAARDLLLADIASRTRPEPG